MDVAEGDVVREALAVLFVFGLLAAAVWKLRTGAFSLPGRSSKAGRLESMGRIALTAQHAVHLLRVDGRELVVATHPQGCSLLATHDERNA